MTKKEATRQLKCLQTHIDGAQAVLDSTNASARQIAEEYFGIRGGDEVEVVDTANRRYTKGIVLTVSGGCVYDKKVYSFGSILVQPYNLNGRGSKLTRSHECRKHYHKKGVLRVTRKAEEVGPINLIPTT